MAENKNVNQINFDYNGKHYCLEYTREAVKRMEAAGFKPGESGATPLNHRKESSRVIEAILDKMKDKEKLLEALRTMVAETYNSLMEPDEGDEGNVEWTATI